MGKVSRTYPLGHFRLYKTNRQKPGGPYVVQLEYVVDSIPVRRATGITVLEKDWNHRENKGRGGIKTSYGSDYMRLNCRLVKLVESNDAKIMDFIDNNPKRHLTVDIVRDILDGKPSVRKDLGMDFCEYVKAILKHEYERNRIGVSVYKNGFSAMKVFGEFLLFEKLGTYQPDKIYISEITPTILDKYITWRRTVKRNKDETINHTLTPILKACNRAAMEGHINPQVNIVIQDMRIVPQTSLQRTKTDVRILTIKQIAKLIDFYLNDSEPRRKEYVQMFLFAMYACGLRFVDVMTLQWSDIDFDKKMLSKIQVKTKNRNIVPLNDDAINILKERQSMSNNGRFVFNLLSSDFNLDDVEALYQRRNTCTKNVGQSLRVVGEKIGLPFRLTFHVARHTFAVMSLNQGITMSMVSQLLGHGSSEITEKVYAHFLPKTMQDEISKLNLPSLS